MMKKIFKIMSLCLIATSSWTCKKGAVCNCFEVAGSQSSEVRAVDTFSQVYVNDDINVYLSIGPQKVEIDGGANLIKNISADVSGGVLTLKNNNICNWHRSYKKSVINVYITMPNITYITSNGVGTIQSTDTLVVNSFQLETKSAGDINLLVRSNTVTAHLFSSSDLTLKGSCNSFMCNFFAGTGFVYCNNLSTNYTFMSNASTGDCHVATNGILDATIYKNGNIYYSGNPTTIHSTIYGKGQLIKE